MTYLDTHVLVWLFSGDVPLLSRKAVHFIQSDELWISPMIVLELEYLHETDRLKVSATRIIDTLQKEIGLQVCNLAFPDITRYAIKENWTRDPFDRIIVGHARAAGCRLLTKDRTIRAHYRKAIW